MDTQAQNRWNQATKEVAKDPRLEEAVERSEGHRQQTQHDVRKGQIGDENVCWVSHFAAPCDDEDDHAVAKKAQNENQRVRHHDDGHEGGLVTGGRTAW